jgi:hypothetical protein
MLAKVAEAVPPRHWQSIVRQLPLVTIHLSMGGGGDSFCTSKHPGIVSLHVPQVTPHALWQSTTRYATQNDSAVVFMNRKREGTC